MKKLGEAAAVLAKLADENPKMTFVFDESYSGLVRVEWMTCLSLEIPAEDLPKAIDCMKKLEALGVETC